LDQPQPGAHDNASGDAVLLEIARTLARLIDNQIIPAPKRSIRFMWIPHMSGLNMYFSAHPEKIGKVKGGCNVDCVGVNPAKFPTKFYVALPPHSLYSPLADIAVNLISRFNQGFDQAVIDGDDEKLLFSPEGSRNLFSATLVPYQGGSDEYTANTRSLNIPSLYFFEEPLPPRHNQINFLDYLDPTNLGRVAYLGALVSYAFASVGPETAVALVREVGFRAQCRIKQELAKVKSRLEKSGREDLQRNLAQGDNLLDWGLKREKRAAGSLKEMTPIEKSLKRLMTLYEQSLDQAVSSAKRELRTVFDLRCADLGVKPGSLSDPPSAEGAGIPVLNPLIKGSPGYFSNYFEDILGDDFLNKYPGVRSSFRYGNVGYYETLNHIDGHNTIADIFNAVQAELWSEGYAAYHFLTFQETVQYLRMLKDAQVITSIN
jgi:N-glycosylase/DNA lyase